MGPTVPAAGTKASSVSQPPRYMPVPGGEPDDLDRMETEWNNRLTYPTGLFDPAWVRLAALKDALIPRGIPGGLPRCGVPHCARGTNQSPRPLIR